MTKNDRSSNVMRQIDENLRRVYKDERTEDVPERFKELLRKLKEQDEGKRNE